MPAVVRDLPLYITPRIGWRMWEVTGRELRAYTGAFWQPGQKQVATCTSRSGGSGYQTCGEWVPETCHIAYPPPNRHCSCGMYSYNSLEALLTWQQHGMNRDKAFCIGTINVFGRVVVCKYGYRSEFATIRGLIYFDDLPRRRESVSKQLAAEYHVETVAFPSLQLFAEEHLGVPVDTPWDEFFREVSRL